jgi:hypothetical protein
MLQSPPPMSSTPMARLALAAPALAALLLALPVRAQVVTVQNLQVTRYDSTGTMQTKRGANSNPDGISRSDCRGPDNLGLTLRFPVSIAPAPTANTSFRVFASVNEDCVALSQRSGQNPRCWAVTPGKVWTQGTDVSVDVRAQDIVSQVNAAQKVVEAPAADVTACDGKGDAVYDVTLYFMLLQPGGESIGTPAKVGVKVKVEGPAPPGGVTATGGDRSIDVGYTPALATGLAEYNVYVDDGAGSLTGDAGGASDAGGSGGCASTSLVEGQFPDGLKAWSVAPSTAASTKIGGLVNGRSYAVALAGRDNFDNVGKLSNVACTQPIDVVDFYDNYRAAGGQAGGGYCSTSAVGLGGRCSTVAAAAVLVGVAVGRRRRSRA